MKLGIIICDRYRSCAGGKCFRSLHEREGGFARYEGEEVELVGFNDAVVDADSICVPHIPLHTGFHRISVLPPMTRELQPCEEAPVPHLPSSDGRR